MEQVLKIVPFYNWTIVHWTPMLQTRPKLAWVTTPNKEDRVPGATVVLQQRKKFLTSGKRYKLQNSAKSIIFFSKSKGGFTSVELK